VEKRSETNGSEGTRVKTLSFLICWEGGSEHEGSVRRLTVLRRRSIEVSLDEVPCSEKGDNLETTYNPIAHLKKRQETEKNSHLRKGGAER